MKIYDLISIADSLDAVGFHDEAKEVDELICSASVSSASLLNQLNRMLNESKKSIFSKEEVEKLLQSASDFVESQGKKEMLDVRDSAISIAEGIKSLTDDIEKMYDKIVLGDKSLLRDYMEDVIKLSKQIDLFNIAASGSRNSDKQMASKIRSIAGDHIARANKAIDIFYSSQLKGLNWVNEFNDIFERASQVIEYKKSIRKLMEDNESLPVDSKAQYEASLKQFDMMLMEAQKNALSIIDKFNTMRVINPAEANSVQLQLGDKFTFVKNLVKGVF